jgi:xylulokinase
VDISGGGKKAGNVSKYLVDRYGFDPGMPHCPLSPDDLIAKPPSADAIVTPFTSDYLSSYLSLCTSPSDAVLNFGPMDMLLTPVQHYLPTRLYSLFTHPAQEPGEKKRYIAMLSSRCVYAFPCVYGDEDS